MRDYVRWVLILVLALALNACGEEESSSDGAGKNKTSEDIEQQATGQESSNNEESEQADGTEEESDKPEPKTEEKGDVLYVSKDYQPFPDPVIKKVIQQLGLCAENDTSGTKSKCSYKLFRPFQYDPNMSWSEGLLLDVRPTVIPGSTTRRLLVVKKVGQNYVILNDYTGRLIEIRKNKKQPGDLVIKYRDPEVLSVTVLHQWNLKTTSYQPKKVLEINDHFVKKEALDSLNNRYIENFEWGD